MGAIVKSEEFDNKLKDLACRGGMSESDEMWPSLVGKLPFLIFYNDLIQMKT